MKEFDLEEARAGKPILEKKGGKEPQGFKPGGCADWKGWSSSDICRRI